MLPPERPQSAEERATIRKRTTDWAPYIAQGVPFHLLAVEEVQQISEHGMLLLTRHWDVAWMLHPTFVDAAIIVGNLWRAIIRRRTRPALAGQPVPFQRPAAPAPARAAARPPQPVPSATPSPAEAAAAYEQAGLIQNGHYVPPEGSAEETMDTFLSILREVEPDAPAAHARP